MGRRRKRLSDRPFELEITSLDSRGMGLAVHDDKNLHVFDALAGELVSARYLFGRNQRGKAETLEVLRASVDRAQPRCPHFGYCGACSLQHLSTQAQLELKQAGLLDQLKKIGNVEPITIYKPLSASQWNYRRKARLSVRDVAAKGRVLVGFRERNGRYVADMQECHVLGKEISDALAPLSALLGELDCRAHVPQIEVACGDHQCVLIVRHLDDISSADAVRLGSFAADTGIGIYLQSGGPDSVSLFAPQDLQLEYAIKPLGLRFRFEPLDFVQVNGELNELMVMRALELLSPQANDNILDLFCGLGNFTLALATKSGHVTGVEGSDEMVERARGNARLNGLDNVKFHTANLYADNINFETDTPFSGAAYDKIMLDPPRSGAQELLPWINATGTGQVLYISCNPETLARDAGLLVHEYGFSLAGAGIINMFPHTTHSEAIALFERGKQGLVQ